jgi:small-conductance mechanosensitive channel
MEAVPERLLSLLVDLATRAVIFVALLVAIFVVYRLVRAVVKRVVRRTTVPLPSELALPPDERDVRVRERRRRIETVAAFGLRLVRWSIYAIVILTAVSTFTPGLWDTIGGLGVGFGAAVGAALGFGAQQLVRDYLNGMLILGENPFGVGDYVGVAGIRGIVEEVGLRRTVVRDAEGTVHSVPNGQILVASNFTRTYARINERVVVAYDTNIAEATRIINEIGADLAVDPEWAGRILEAPKVARVDAIVDPGIPILIVGKVRPGDQWAVAGELRKRIVERFAAAGIDLATARLLVDRRRPERFESEGDGEGEFT